MGNFTIESVHTLDEDFTNEAAMCPLMSGMVVVPPKSDMYPARLRFNSSACLQERCAWWVETADLAACAIWHIGRSLK